MNSSHYEEFNKEVEAGDYLNWTLDVPYFKWETDKIITGDSFVDSETKQKSQSVLLDPKSASWGSFGKTLKEAETAFRSEVLDRVLNKYPEMTLVASKICADPWEARYVDGKPPKYGFFVGFVGGFVENPRESPTV